MMLFQLMKDFRLTWALGMGLPDAPAARLDDDAQE